MHRVTAQLRVELRRLRKALVTRQKTNNCGRMLHSTTVLEYATLPSRAERRPFQSRSHCLTSAPCRCAPSAFFKFPWQQQQQQQRAPPQRIPMQPVPVSEPIEGNTAVGIDLGTTNSAVAVWKDGKAEVIESSSGSVSCPPCSSMMRTVR